MKKRTLARTLATVALILVILAAYLLFYLFPSMEKINRLRRETVRSRERQREMLSNHRDFEPLTAGEWRFISRKQGLFSQNLPRVTSTEEIRELIRSYGSRWQNLADRAGLNSFNLRPSGSGFQSRRAEESRINTPLGILNLYPLQVTLNGSTEAIGRFLVQLAAGRYLFLNRSIHISRIPDPPKLVMQLELYFYNPAASQPPAHHFPVEIDNRQLLRPVNHKSR